MKACEQGRRMLFTTAMGLLATLGKALAEYRLDERLKLLAQPALLIIENPVSDVTIHPTPGSIQDFLWTSPALLKPCQILLKDGR